MIERDYALGYVLAGMAKEPALADSLAFKGGTALRKLFFGDYRFSEDLDFSAMAVPSDGWESHVQAAAAYALRLLNEHGPFSAETVRLHDPATHPGAQEAYIVRLGFPWQTRAMCPIKLEITVDEPVLLPPVPRALIHGYDEALTVPIKCYRLEEIVVEKMRSLLQTHQKLVTRPWTRPRARDYYDLWRILNAYADAIDREGLTDLLVQKSRHRGVSFASVDDFFTPELVSEAIETWDGHLASFVRDLPACEIVLDELRRLIPTFFRDLSWRSG